MQKIYNIHIIYINVFDCICNKINSKNNNKNYKLY